MSGALCAVDLSKAFRNVPVLDGLNFEVPDGSVFGLVGPNGAGKTTTIKILMNILKPTAGRTEVLGVNSRQLGPEHLTQIGYASENQQMPDWMTVRYFELPLNRRLRHLSRGMRMKAALASSLAYRPRLLVLDEPFSGLDPVVREDLIEGLIESAAETTILISSHDLAEIESFASHIGYLDGGRLRFSEEMTSLTARFREIEVTLQPPAILPASGEWPSNWLRPDATPALVRFVETRFDPDRTSSQINRLFGDVRQISVKPMPLRAIFVALARSGSKAA